MVVYATADDVRLAVARDPLQTRGSAATLNDDQLDQAITDAQAEVDGRLRSRYTVPFADPVPALVSSVTTDIAAYLAALTYYQEKELPEVDPAVRRYNRACCLLKDIADGEVDLDTGDGGASAPRTGGGLSPAVPARDGPLFGLTDFGLARRACRGWW